MSHCNHYYGEFGSLRLQRVNISTEINPRKGRGVPGGVGDTSAEKTGCNTELYCGQTKRMSLDE